MRKYLLALAFLASLWGCRKSDSKPANSLPVDYNNKRTGASAHDLLSADTYTSLKIEIQYMPGYRPDANAIEHLKTTIGNLLNKPAGIQVTYREIPSAGKSVLSLEEAALVEKQYRTVFTGGKEMGVHLLFTDGGYTEPKVLGVAYRNTSLCLFGKTLHDNSGSFGQVSRSTLQATVLEHELGHILGLVDVGSPMQTPHKDDANGNHCTNQDCLMYYAAETTDMLGFLGGGTVPAFDNACRADLKANGGK